MRGLRPGGRYMWHEWKLSYMMARPPGQGRGSQIEDNASEALAVGAALSEPPSFAGGGTTCDVDEPREDDDTRLRNPNRILLVPTRRTRRRWTHWPRCVRIAVHV